MWTPCVVHLSALGSRLILIRSLIPYTAPFHELKTKVQAK